MLKLYIYNKYAYINPECISIKEMVIKHQIWRYFICRQTHIVLGSDLFTCLFDLVLRLLMSFQSVHVLSVEVLSYQVRLAGATGAPISPFSLEAKHYECQADEKLMEIEQLELPGCSIDDWSWLLNDKLCQLFCFT